MNMASEYSAMLNKHQAYRAPRKTPPPRYGLVEAPRCFEWVGGYNGAQLRALS